MKTVSTPPPYGDVDSRIKAFTAAFALVLTILASIFLIHSATSSPDASASNALPVYYVDTLDEIPSSEVFLTDLVYEHAAVNIKDSRFSFVKNSSQPSVVYNGVISVGTTYTFTNPFAVEFKEAGYTTDGRKVDVSIMYDKVSFTPIQSTTATQTAVAMFNRLGGNSPFCFNASAYGKPKTRIEATIRITYSDTNALVPGLIQLTFADLDGYESLYPEYAEGITLGDGFIQTYLRKDHIFDKTRITSSNGRSFAPSSYKEAAGWEEWYMASTYFKGGQASLTWTGIWCGTEIGASYKGYPEWNAPEKKAMSGDAFDIDAPITYEISQFLPYTAQTNQASNVTISDALPDIFDISKTSAKILNGMREDVSAKWNITISPSTNTVTAKAKEAYESLGQHYLIIETSIKHGADISRYMVSQESGLNTPATSVKAIIDNTAETTINDTTKKSNTVKISSESHPLLYALNGGDDKGTATDICLDIEEALSEYRGFHIPGENIALSTGIPQRDGYVFFGWTEQRHDPSNDKEEYDELSSKTITNIEMPSEQATVYAAWAKKPTVKYIVAGIEESSQQLVPGGNGTPPPSPSKPGHTFNGWSDSAVNVYEDMEITAIFSPNRYTISYDPNDGSGYMDDQEMTYDEEDAVKQNEYAREHYEFVGWNTEPDGTGTTYTPGESMKNLTEEANGQITLYAQWRFYIQMPETGENGNASLLALAFALIMASIVSAVRSKTHNRTRSAVNERASRR